MLLRGWCKKRRPILVFEKVLDWSTWQPWQISDPIYPGGSSVGAASFGAAPGAASLAAPAGGASFCAGAGEGYAMRKKVNGTPATPTIAPTTVPSHKGMQRCV